MRRHLPAGRGQAALPFHRQGRRSQSERLQGARRMANAPRRIPGAAFRRPGQEGRECPHRPGHTQRPGHPPRPGAAMADRRPLARPRGPRRRLHDPGRPRTGRVPECEGADAGDKW